MGAERPTKQPRPPLQCDALAYPRTLPDVFTTSDRRALSRLFGARVGAPSPTRHYWTLLMALATKPESDPLWTAVKRMQARVAGQFAPRRFVMVNDFFSWRHPEAEVFAPLWHTDNAFWSVEGCRGFNLWVLLDERGGLNHTFDVIEASADPTHAHAEFYRRLYGGGAPSRPAPRDLVHGLLGGRGDGDESVRARNSWWPSTLASLSQRLGFGGGRGSTTPPRPSSSRGAASSSVFELKRGEALVLRQPEVHRTDAGPPLLPAQYRLAIGFKFVEELPLRRTVSSFTVEYASSMRSFRSAYTIDWERANRSLPCLLPQPELGETVVSPYDAAYVRRSRAAQPRCFANVDRVVSRWDEQRGERFCAKKRISSCGVAHAGGTEKPMG